MTDQTGFRLYLDTDYAVSPWPFARDWRAVVADMPAELPGGVGDFDQFLPDDHYNRTHGPLAREHASVRTEMAVYRDGEALIVLLRLWHGAPLPARVSPPNGEGATLVLMRDQTSDEAFYAGIDPQGRFVGLRWTGLQPDSSATRMGTEVVKPEGFAAAAHDGLGYWTAGFRVPLAAIPGGDANPATVAFTAGRLWGETFETLGWATSTVWAPQPAEMGTLHLSPWARPAGAYLARADYAYDTEAETGELSITLGGETPADVLVTINTHPTHHEAVADRVTQPWTPEDGMNYIVVKVGEAPSIRIDFEKWSGHRLFVKYPCADPLPTREALADAFAEWHAQKERIYVEPGIWSSLIMKAYGYDHNCAFVMEPYAYACLYLDRQPIYEQRVREACDRLVREQSPDGVFLCYHFSANPQPFEGGAFGHGSASEALCLGYRALGDERYLEASTRAAEAYVQYRLENNTNYMAFVLWHLSELYELTGNFTYVERAVWYAQHGIIRGMIPSGAYPGHNYYTAYGNITLKGLAKLLRVLPSDHPFYATLHERTLRFTNQILSRQRVNGLFDGLNRMYFGYQHSVPGLFEVARALPEIAPVLEPALNAMLHARPAGMPYQPDGLDLVWMARYLTERSEKEIGQ